ncbi:MAG TPA: hypothetical protein VLA83_00315 [Candidatus Binatia bacterium]|nr:hypothetical protein [Candidatus Binatia bacterium]
MECALGTGGVLVRHHDPANRVWKWSACSALHALARSTGAAINQGQETATQHDCGAFGYG